MSKQWLAKIMNRTNISSTDRRAFLQRLGTMLGVATVATLAAGSSLNVALAYQPKLNSAAKAGKIFSLKQMKILERVAETILPRTDTPGAADLDCHGFVDHQLANCYTEQDRENYLSAVNLFDKSFISLSPEARQKKLIDLEAGKGFDENQRNQFRALKSLIVFGYFTSEYGASKALRYDPVPGGFKVIPYKPGDKGWGSHAYY